MIARQYYSCNEMRREGLTVFDPPSSIELILPMTFEDLGFKPVTLLMRICQNAPSDYAVPFRRAHGTTCIHTGDFLFANVASRLWWRWRNRTNDQCSRIYGGGLSFYWTL